MHALVTPARWSRTHHVADEVEDARLGNFCEVVNASITFHTRYKSAQGYHRLRFPPRRKPPPPPLRSPNGLSSSRLFFHASKRVAIE